MSWKQIGTVILLTTITLGSPKVSQAVIRSSGSAETLKYGYHEGTGGGLDANTIHYWSLDETGTINGSNPFNDQPQGTLTVPSTALIPMASQTSTSIIDSILKEPTGAVNNARVIGTTNTQANRITAFANTTNTLADNLSLDQANSFATGGAFTVDMVFRTDFEQSLSSGTSMRMISQENDELNPSNFAVNYAPDTMESGVPDHTIKHYMELSLGGKPVRMVVPFTGDHALVNGGWYHFAAVYNGDESDPNNTQFYWTRILDRTDATTAAVPGTILQFSDLSPDTPPANTADYASSIAADAPVLVNRPEFTFGNETNGTSNKSFDGAIDYIRISNVVRGAGDFIFTTPSEVLDGDFNGDGFVDAADYVTWRKGLGTEFEPEDYDLWAANFGASGASGGSVLSSNSSLVPEPASLVLLLTMIAGLALPRRSR